MQKDIIQKFEDIDILIHEQDMPHFENATIDVVRDLYGKRKFSLVKD
ncbi:hypothetical protein [Peribacillus sp. SCS-155]